ncbi:uncharacterized protein [Rutidosis leptorrhynchoides]|uniref:uncharacterized protein n=1 Tax=Rutidosis leptorrhynchoides TaxID=125765 RepID=UPI003A99B014
MRIRKNAKNISALLYTSTTNVSSNLNININAPAAAADNQCLQHNFCELNQSPWDIITFPPSNSSSSLHQFDNYEVDYNDNVAGHRSSIVSVGDYKSVAPSKTSELRENDHVKDSTNDCDEKLGFKDGVSSDDEIEEEIKLCGEMDENGWQCGRVVTKGTAMCELHLSKFQNAEVWPTKKKCRRGLGGPVIGARPKRAKKRPTANPHDYYYYSGFGPSWGKKRGDGPTVSSGVNINDMDIQEENGKRFEPEMSETRPIELDDDIDINDDEKGKLEIFEKKKPKRMRKPVKERSLKSLM